MNEPPRIAPEFATILAQAEAGDALAALKLARVCDLAGQHEAALQWLERSAEGGQTSAQTLLGMRLVVGRAAPFDPGRGAALVLEAANAGFAEAWHYIAVFRAAGVAGPQDWAGALDALHRAAGGGLAKASTQIELLRTLGLGTLAAVQDWLVPPSREMFCDSPRIVTGVGLLPAAFCTHLMRLASPRLSSARILDAEAGGRRPDSMRTNSGAGLGLAESDIILQLARAKVAAFAGAPLSHQEPANILHYAVGERYEPHVDYLDPSIAHFAADLRGLGQRVKTALVYLSAEFDGGETEFTELNRRFCGRVGEAIVFDNVHPNRQVDPRTLHAGLAPTRGEKWLLSIWIRERPVPLV